MEHGLDSEVLAIIAASVVLWGLLATRLERFSITAPVAFLVLGLLAANKPLDLIDVHASSEAVRTVTEITLALVLFGDASRVNIRELRRDAGVPARLLLIGLPLTIALGFAAALVVFSGMDPWVAALIAAAVAPTDAALGAPIIEDERIPLRVRRTINVESGLNDGIATPVVAFFVAGAASETVAHTSLTVFSAFGALVSGAVAGAAVGAIGGLLLVIASRHRWTSAQVRPFVVLGLSVLSYSMALQVGGNGFVAAFVGGLGFGAVERGHLPGALELTNDAGELGSILVWFIFGALIVSVLEDATWHMAVYAVLSLTVVRMVPVAISLIGSRLDRATVGLIGWFGPRGLASVVFALIAYDTLDAPESQMVLSVVAATILLSVIAHGISASPLAGWYGRRAAALDADVPEHAESTALAARPFTRPRNPLP